MAESDHKTTAPSLTTETSEPKLTPKQRRRNVGHDVQDAVPSNATTRTQPERMDLALKHARICARIADDNRARNVLLLDLREATPLVDFFVIATASSRRQSHAIASEIDQEMKQLNEYKLGIEGSEEGRWILIDYGDFVVHILSGEARAYYALEEIWGDAPRLEWQDTEHPRPAPADDRAAEPAPEDGPPLEAAPESLDA
jgi:ribosome-associated protein